MDKERKNMKVYKSMRVLSCTFLLGAALFSGSLAAPTAYAASLPQTDGASSVSLRTITVTGYGEIKVQPDIAYIQFGLQTTGKTAREAQDKNAKQFKAISAALEKLQVKAADIQTVRFTTMPDYSWENNKQQFQGYQVEQIIQVKYRNLSGVGSLMDTVTAAGANRIENVWFSSEKMDEYRMNATDTAIDNARLKAERIAARTGVKIKEAIQITDGSTPIPPIYTYDLPRAVGSAEQKTANDASQVYPGELTVSSTITITYSY
jgi:uncharacterized protein YggE